MVTYSLRSVLCCTMTLVATITWAQPQQQWAQPQQQWAQQQQQYVGLTQLTPQSGEITPYGYPSTGITAPRTVPGPALGWEPPADRNQTWVSHPTMPRQELARAETSILQEDGVFPPGGNTLPEGTASPLPGTWGDPGGDGGGCDDCCNDCLPIVTPTRFVSAGGMFLTRGRPEFFQMSYNDADLTSAEISSVSGTGGWDVGPQLQIVWPIGCTRSLQTVYWGIYGDNSESTAYAADIPGDLNTTFDFGLLTIGGTGVNSLYDGAAAHRLRRDYDIHNIEFNFLCGNMPNCGCQCLDVNYLVGLRYMRFTEGWEYASADTDPVFGNDPDNEAYYNIDLENHMLGVQAGMRADWHILQRLSFFGGAKFGVYNNYIEHRSLISNANGIATFVPGYPPISGQQFDIVSNTNALSTIGELDLGVSYKLGMHWSASLGYRAIGVGGVALPGSQVPGYGRMPGVEGIVHDSWMLLHGTYASIEFLW